MPIYKNVFSLQWMLLRSASLLSASSIVIVPIPFFNVLFISYRRCCNKSRGKLRFGVLHTFHLKRAACSRRINREIPAFVAGISVSELFKFPVVQQRCDQHHKAGTCMVTTTCATLRWRWEYDMRMEDASTALPSFFVEIMRLLWIHHLTLWQRAYESGRDCGHGRRQVHYAA